MLIAAGQIKGVGHASNLGFSSTTGVQVVTSKFQNITYDESTEIVTVGAGVTWDQVYDVVAPYGRNAAGARAEGVGVAGFTLGGGLSIYTSFTRVSLLRKRNATQASAIWRTKSG